MHSLVRLNDVALRLGRREVLGGITWTIHAGESWAIVGAAGTGKSCLAKLLSGELRPTSGEICYGSASGKPKIRRLAFGGAEEVSGRGSPYYQARWYGSEEESSPKVRTWLGGRLSPERAALLRLLGLAPVLERRLMHLSNGEFRKLTIAKVLFEKPALLILDDPFSGLDKESRRAIMRIFSSAAGSGSGVILAAASSDDIPAGVRGCLVLKGGKASIVEGRAAVSSLRKRDAAVRPAVSAASRSGRRRGKCLVEMRGVTVSYNGSAVLNSIDWTVREGEHWLVTGPNGSGKSTLLSLILADHPQSYLNDLVLFGKRRGSGESIWEIKKHIGWLAPELEAHYPGSATVLDAVCSGCFDSLGLHRPCSSSGVREARRLLADFGLRHAAGRLFGTLATGEKRLTLLARALIKRPKLLLLDEPTFGLHSAARKRLIQAVDKACGRQGPALVWITHNPQEAPQAITHRLTLRAGRIAAKEGKI